MAYCIRADGEGLSQDPTLRELVATVFYHDVRERRIPALPLLQDISLARDALGSFLAGDRGQHLAGLLEPEVTAGISGLALRSLAETAFSELGKDDADHSAWLTLQAVLHDLPIYREQVESLSAIIKHTDFADLVVKAPRHGILALQLASSQMVWIDDTGLHQFFGEELIRIANALAKAESRRDSISAPESGAETWIELAGAWLLEAAHNVALSHKPIDSTVNKFAELLRRLVDTWPSMAGPAWIAVQQMYERLPIRTVKYLYSLLIWLRTRNARGFGERPSPNG